MGLLGPIEGCKGFIVNELGMSNTCVSKVEKTLHGWLGQRLRKRQQHLSFSWGSIKHLDSHHKSNLLGYGMVTRVSKMTSLGVNVFITATFRTGIDPGNDAPWFRLVLWGKG